jgi:hypothetical protein
MIRLFIIIIIILLGCGGSENFHISPPHVYMPHQIPTTSLFENQRTANLDTNPLFPITFLITPTQPLFH